MDMELYIVQCTMGTLPEGKYGVNFGISLSLWDYLFRTNYIPEQSGTIPLGFPADQSIPKSFWNRLVYGFKSKKKGV